MDARSNDLLTLEEAADYVRTPVATLRYWRHCGTGPTSFKIGRHVMYRATDLDAWIAEQIRISLETAPGLPARRYG